MFHIENVITYHGNDRYIYIPNGVMADSISSSHHPRAGIFKMASDEPIAFFLPSFIPHSYYVISRVR